MKKVLLSGVLMLLASVSLLAAAMCSADVKAAGQFPQQGQVFHRQGRYLSAQAQKSRSSRPRQAPLQPQAIPPEIWLDSYSTQPGQTIGFGGRGFQPGEQVDVRIGDLEDVPSKSASRLLTAAFANEGGNVNGEATIPFLPSGDYPFIVVGLQSQKMLIRNLTVLGFAPWVVLDNYAPPPSVPLGFKGQGFAAGEPVLVYFDQQTGQPVTQLKADGKGQFAVYQGVVLPAQTGDHSLILVGVYSGSVVKVDFEILPLQTPPPGPPPTNSPLALLAQPTHYLTTGSRMTAGSQMTTDSQARAVLLAPAVGMGSAFGVLSLQNPAMLVLLVLLLWLLLCVSLALLLLIAPLLRKLSFRRRSSQGTAMHSVVEYGDLTEAGAPASSVTGVIASAPLSIQPHAHSPARFCPRCGAHVVPGESRCALCRGELPQGAEAGAASEGKERARSQAPAIFPAFSPWSPDAPASLSGEKQTAWQASLAAIPGREREEYRSAPHKHQPGLAMRFSAKSDRGRKRAARENEDSFLAVTGALRSTDKIEPFGLFVVADGMGGHDDGHKASGVAVETLFHFLVPSLLQQEWPAQKLLPLLAEAIQEVNERLYQANQRDHTSMGCTVTAALITGREAHICNVGDSRTYLLGSLAALQRVTVDHSLVESLVVAGIIQRADVYTHPKRNQIFRCLGHQPWVEVDTFRQPLASGEKVLLCSDGLWEMVRDPEMEATLRRASDVAQASNLLVARANENGGLDNVTVIVVELTSEDGCLNQPGITSISSTQSGLLVGPV